MFFRGTEYCGNLVVVEDGRDYNTAKAYVFDFTRLNDVDFSDGLPGKYPVNTIRTFMSVREFDDDISIRKDCNDCPVLVCIRRGDNSFKGTLYGNDGEVVDEYYSTDIDDIVQWAFIYNVRMVSNFSDSVRVGIMEELLRYLENKVPVIFSSLETEVAIHQHFWFNNVDDDMYCHYARFVYDETFWGNIIQYLTSSCHISNISVYRDKETGIFNVFSTTKNGVRKHFVAQKSYGAAELVYTQIEEWAKSGDIGRKEE